MHTSWGLDFVGGHHAVGCMGVVCGSIIFFFFIVGRGGDGLPSIFGGFLG